MSQTSNPFYPNDETLCLVNNLYLTSPPMVKSTESVLWNFHFLFMSQTNNNDEIPLLGSCPSPRHVWRHYMFLCFLIFFILYGWVFCLHTYTYIMCLSRMPEEGMWVLGIKPGSCTRAASALNGWVATPAPGDICEWFRQQWLLWVYFKKWSLFSLSVCFSQCLETIPKVCSYSWISVPGIAMHSYHLGTCETRAETITSSKPA